MEDSLNLIITLGVTLGASAFFSGAESAFFSLDRVALNRLERFAHFPAKTAFFLQKRFSSLIITLLMMNMLANILATVTAANLLVSVETAIAGHYGVALTTEVAFIVNTVFLLSFPFVLIIFCEFLPKRLGIAAAVRIVQWISPLLFPLYVLLLPITLPLSYVTRRLVHSIQVTGEARDASPYNETRRSRFRLEKASPTTNKRNHGEEKTGHAKDKERELLPHKPVKKNDEGINTDDEFFSIPFDHDQFLSYLRLSSHAGVLKEMEFGLLKNFVTYKNMEVRSFMIPRERMQGLNLDKKRSIESLKKAIQQFPHKNIPFYRTQKDNIIGTLSQEKCAFMREGLAFSTMKAFVSKLDPPLIIPETKNVLAALEDLLNAESEVALISDEYGGIEGIITYDDILAKFFGGVSASEETASETRQIKRVGKGFFRVRGDISINEINEYFGVSLYIDTAETLGGYLTEKLRALPKRYDTYEDMFFKYTVQECTVKHISVLILEPIRRGRSAKTTNSEKSG